jgi:Protein of unknown function (DUF2855)
MMAAEPYDIVVDRNDLAKIRVSPASPIEIGTDQVHVRIESYALTANNITYGVVGNLMKYWSFYPAAAGMGRIPVWGFGTIAKSSRTDVAAGERLYGFWPMSSDALLTIGRATPASLTETSQHRRDLAPVYNSYVRVAADAGMPTGSEPYVSLMRPLFATSFLIDDFLAESGFFGAGTVLITSASSKTSIGLAYCLKQRGSGRPKIVGLTSQRNAAFAAGLGIYDDVVTYDAIHGLRSANGAAIVDMAGSVATLRALHSALGDDLKYSCRVGLTHWQDTKPEIDGLPGVRPVFFFAPDRVRARLADWGPQEFAGRVGGASAAFVAHAQRWLRIETHRGPEAIVAAYRTLLKGEARPDAGVICVP